MSRIDALVAANVADTVRAPDAINRATAHQVQHAQVKAIQDGARGDIPQPVTPEEVRAASLRIKQVIEVANGQQLAFHVDEDSKELLVKIMEEKTGKVIRQIPSQELLDMEKRIHEMVGLLLNERA